MIRLLRGLVDHFADAPAADAAGARRRGRGAAAAGSPEAAALAVRYVSGMTDRFALGLGVELLGWRPDDLPAASDAVGRPEPTAIASTPDGHPRRRRGAGSGRDRSRRARGRALALKRVGKRFVGLCPFHAEKTPSFNVNPEMGRYYCFGCQASGDAISFVREVEHLDFVDAVERLAARAGITLRYDDKSVTQGPGRKAAPQRSGRRRDRRSTSSCCSSRPKAATPASTCAAAASTATRCASSSSAGRPTAGIALSVHLQQQEVLARRHRRRRSRVREQGEQAAGPVPRPPDVPDLRQQGRTGRLRRPRARRRRPEVQELARDPDLPEEPPALRAQLGEGRDRRARRRSSSARATPT